MLNLSGLLFPPSGAKLIFRTTVSKFGVLSVIPLKEVKPPYRDHLAVTDVKINLRFF